MRKKAAYIFLAVLLAASAVGVKEIYTIAKNATNNANVFYADVDNSYTGAKYNEKQQNDAIKAAKCVLGSGIKMRASNFSSRSRVIVCYTENLYMELEGESLCPVVLLYECRPSFSEYSREDLSRRALCFVLRNVPRRVRVTEPQVKFVEEQEHILSFLVKLGDNETAISLRADTGSVVYYNGSSLFER